MAQRGCEAEAPSGHTPGCLSGSWGSAGGEEPGAGGAQVLVLPGPVKVSKLNICP